MDTFSALADPTRRSIVEMLAAGGQLSAGDISRRFDSSPPAISQHLKVLRQAELVRMEKQAQQRLYSINPGAFDEVEQWIRQMRQFWSVRLDALEELLTAEDATASKANKMERPR
jgi:DNA-binding transcriptional ArsR family regulator